MSFQRHEDALITGPGPGLTAAQGPGAAGTLRAFAQR
ncbi:hypothetical protein J2S43_007620 [Catenuloplanes nepalensis]|uniref:Uncharacterized protein n=1 Tax=Catenuloplanes nepalensis TaxID=587533 RepID=A0ABT9N5Z1_9ACTN|nr:hypothetical protein [Catenuloplanes nepalensis]